ncbi:hypothetical protein M433DRAFT_155711 [Acidomyces richmondensis BFW]|nr:MAG: hypothetical protein FE78DRAFT_92523 [Acidomyces sp. 'richmondensis']KYG44365.1 hypothetical protein M433DRAFT_155711 [Acidomyces richmondensis BFW]
MFDEMHDIASQLVLKWARMGPGYRIPVTSDFTRLTLDTIALCAMDYRFNSFYQDDMHPFVQAMNSRLSAASDRFKVGSMIRKLMPWDKTGEKIEQDSQYMGKVANELVQLRKEHPTEKRDLLNAMIHGKDPKTGQSMPDGLISSNMITFLIAGHETTSGLLSFAFLNLLKNPESYFKAQQEVDRVIGRGRMKTEHLKDLKYINAVLRETLRLTPTAPGFSRSIRRDNPNDVEQLAGGKYAINRDDKVLCMITKCQRDPKVYGEDANEFKPERMLDENFNKLPKSAWRPFGTGVRACIGQAFAWQEAQMAVALLLQNFNFRLDDPSYEMKVKQTLTIKPEGFYMRATLRDGISATSLQASLSSSDDTVKSAMEEGIKRANVGRTENLKPMTILYGSNTGTCMSLAQKLSVEARRYGYHADVKEMDASVDAMRKDQPTVIITASYEGEPPDNARQFVKWLEMVDSTLEGVEYAVFGCGHSDWVTTFQRVPTLVDGQLEKLGAKRLASRGFANAADGDIFSAFDMWTDHIFWPAVASSSPEKDFTRSGLEVEMSTHSRSSYLRQDVKPGTVKMAKRLTAAGEPEKRHLEVRLPEGMTYNSGDYLAVLPLNPLESVGRAQRHFKLPSDATIMIKPGGATFLPTGVSLSVTDLLRGFVELGLSATRKDIEACMNTCKDPKDRAALQELIDKVSEQRYSVLDLLEMYPSVEMPFSQFISILQPLRPRHYSISSSPLWDPTTCTITYAIINDNARSGLGRYIGVTGAYLSNLVAGDEVLVAVRATNKYFHLPTDVDNTPVMMFGAGTGLAPFRGFIQERAKQLAAGRKLAPALLFMGCRSATSDRLYAEEIDEWSQSGAVDVRYAFSREPEKSQGCRYVQERMIKDAGDVVRMFSKGAKCFTCSGPAASDGISKAAVKIYQDRMKELGKEMNDEEAKEWFRQERNERFVVDVFA